jgi:hypothetical protein
MNRQRATYPQNKCGLDVGLGWPSDFLDFIEVSVYLRYLPLSPLLLLLKDHPGWIS